MIERNKDILIIIGLFSLAFLLRVDNISNVHLYPDEWAYWFKANRILASSWEPTAEIVEHASPFLSYIGAAVTVIFGGELNNLRMISVVFGSLTVPALYLFGKSVYDRKTGLLSALFLCFSAFHILWSRIFMLEAITLFFVTAFLYFFWLSHRYKHQQKSMMYAAIAGAMLGLGIAAKYLPIFLVPAILFHAFWTEKFNFKAMMDKRIFLVLTFAFLFFLPVLICFYYTGVDLDPIYYQAVERFEIKHPSSGSGVSILELGINSIDTQIDILSWGSQVLMPAWKNLYWASTIMLLTTALLLYLPESLKKEKTSSFFLISIFMFVLLLVNLSPYKHYLIYFFPFFIVMISHVAIESFERLRGECGYKNIFRVFIVFLTIIMLFSSFVVGVTSSYWDEGEYSWAKDAVDYVKSDLDKSGYEEHILIGWITPWKIVDYSIDVSNINASDVSILKLTPSEFYVDLEKINILKPEYLIVGEDQYNFYFTGITKNEIFNNYKIISDIHAYPQKCIIFKKKNIQTLELKETEPIGGKKGRISQDMFKKSLPCVMKLGNVYTVLVEVTNTGDSRTNYVAVVRSDEYTLFSEELSVDLDSGSSRILKFKIVPLKEYVKKLPVTAGLYVAYEENETYEKVSSSTDYVDLIKK